MAPVWSHRAKKGKRNLIKGSFVKFVKIVFLWNAASETRTRYKKFSLFDITYDCPLTCNYV